MRRVASQVSRDPQAIVLTKAPKTISVSQPKGEENQYLRMSLPQASAKASRVITMNKRRSENWPEISGVIAIIRKGQAD